MPTNDFLTSWYKGRKINTLRFFLYVSQVKQNIKTKPGKNVLSNHLYAYIIYRILFALSLKSTVQERMYS